MVVPVRQYVQEQERKCRWAWWVTKFARLVFKISCFGALEVYLKGKTNKLTLLSSFSKTYSLHDPKFHFQCLVYFFSDHWTCKPALQFQPKRDSPSPPPSPPTGMRKEKALPNCRVFESMGILFL